MTAGMHDYLDPRWEWHDVTALGDLEPRYVKGRCLHLHVIPVGAVDGTVVAGLCLVCDAQLPAALSPGQ
jgi:hypothetical protein